MRVWSVVAMGLLLLACSTATEISTSGTSESLQHDLDIARLQDLKSLSGDIEKYHAITGKYPFQDEVSVPHYVHIATKEQQKYARNGPPYEHKKTAAKEFVSELMAVLGNDIQVPFDLQRVPVNKPNFYIYVVTEDVYYLAVHVHNDFSFANRVADFYHKVEVTNNADGNRKGTWYRDQLLSNPAFNAALVAPPYKPGYTEQLRVRLGGNEAF